MSQTEEVMNEAPGDEAQAVEVPFILPEPSPREEIKLTDSEYKELRRVISEVNAKKRVFPDWNDDSRHPSYTHFQIPYHIQCRDRYVRKRALYEEQIQGEISDMLRHMGSAYEEARFQRHLSISTMWPPLHNRSEIAFVQRFFFRLTPRQQDHLKYLRRSKIT